MKRRLFAAAVSLLVTVALITAATAALRSMVPRLNYISLTEVMNIPVERAGFDIDNTLLYSDQAFNEVKRTTNIEEYTDAWWREVNLNSNPRLCVKKREVYRVFSEYRKRGVPIYAITARKAPGGETLKRYVNEVFGIPEDSIYFEPDSKTRRIEDLDLDIFFGDSDTDLEYAGAAGIPGIRILRHPESTYWENYKPGCHGERILQHSAR